MGTSKRMIWCETVRGTIIAERPKIKRTLKILLPTTLPSAISACPAKAPPILTASSGALVPNATTVKPTIRGEMPRADAAFDEPLTNISAPTMRKIKPEINSRIVI